MPTAVALPALLASLFVLQNTSVYLFVRFVTAHLADSVFEHGILLEEMIYRHLALGIVMHRTLKEETEKPLYAIAPGAGSKVA